MFLASHNSWSYGRPSKWWMYLFQPFTKCQNKTVREQAGQGIKHFDLRIKIVNGKAYVAHGLVTYRFTMAKILEDLEYIRMWSAPQTPTVRVLLENRHPAKEDEMFYYDTCLMIDETFSRLNAHKIIFYGGHGAHGKTWRKQYYTFKDAYLFGHKLVEQHASVCGGIFPYRFAKRNNELIIDENRLPNVLLMIDFV